MSTSTEPTPYRIDVYTRAPGGAWQLSGCIDRETYEHAEEHLRYIERNSDDGTGRYALRAGAHVWQGYEDTGGTLFATIEHRTQRPSPWAWHSAARVLREDFNRDRVELPRYPFGRS